MNSKIVKKIKLSAQPVAVYRSDTCPKDALKFKNLYSTIYHLRKRVCKWEMETIASEEETGISKSLASLREWPSQERVRSTTQRQGRTCH